MATFQVPQRIGQAINKLELEMSKTGIPADAQRAFTKMKKDVFAEAEMIDRQRNLLMRTVVTASFTGAKRTVPANLPVTAFSQDCPNASSAESVALLAQNALNAGAAGVIASQDMGGGMMRVYFSK